MKKMNNRGFAVSTILYGILALTILILMLIFGIMKSNKEMNAGLVESITDAMDKCVKLEIKLENCYLNGEGDCKDKLEQYHACINKEDETTPIIPSDINKLRDKILNDNIAYADNVSSTYVTASTGINFGAISSNTNGKGLYYTSTNTEQINGTNGTTYYFRGAVKNNYVKFGKDSSGNDIIWRIVRINEDGSIRLVTQDIVGDSVFNTNSGDNAYVGYMYGSTGQSGDNAYNLTHSNDNPSTIKTYIDNWYTNNTNLSNYKDSHLADAGFCNDRSVAPTSKTWVSSDTALGYGTKYTVYGAYNRLYTNKTPQFACPNEERDLFTTNASSKGNKALSNPIGLLTIDEVAYAGSIRGQVIQNMYLTNGDWYWTMSPVDFVGSSAGVWNVSGVGSANDGSVHIEHGVRPVVNLQSGVEITGGNGTSGNPYVIK